MAGIAAAGLAIYGVLQQHDQTPSKTMQALWNRPTALGLTSYATAHHRQLLELFHEDNQAARKSGVEVPPRSSDAVLRVAQWNVHYFSCPRSFRQTGDWICAELERHGADVVILNEFGTFDNDGEAAAVLRRLGRAGYGRHQVAAADYPTCILTRRHDDVDRVEQFDLDGYRGAVVMRLKLLADGAQRSCGTEGGEGDFCPSADTANPEDDGVECGESESSVRYVWVYGTHLNDTEDWTGMRADEMQVLLDHVAANVSAEDSVIIAGDFNSQRPEDHLPDEWVRIVANKMNRGYERPTDGVSDLLQRAGYASVWDDDDGSRRNWPAGGPPPATHWSGTVIDFAYYRSGGTTDGDSNGHGNNLRNIGAYVSPASGSDHRLIVTDWQLEQDRKKWAKTG